MPRTHWFEKSIAALKAPVMFSCHDMTRLISRAQDDTLPGVVRGKMRLHFLTCAGCRRYAEHLGFLRGALHRLSESAEGIPAQSLHYRLIEIKLGQRIDKITFLFPHILAPQLREQLILFHFIADSQWTLRADDGRFRRHTDHDNFARKSRASY